MAEDLTKVPSFALAMRDFFGMNGKSLKDFTAELRALTDADKEYFKEQFTAAGIKFA